MLGVIGGNIIVNAEQFNKAHPIEYAQAQKPPQEILIETKIEWTEERIIEEIKKTFPEQPERMVKVARCESGIKNVPGQLSDDGGIFQINITHKEVLEEQGLDRFDIGDNIKFARYLYDHGGLSHWKASKDCWSK